jgi:cytochrome c biogenesis protein CcmG/thiol:disulfide interchange protein DsbE
VTYNDTAPDARSFLKKYGVTFPVLRDVDEAFAHHLKVTGIPETFVLDRRGTIAASRRAPVDERWLRTAVAKAERA